jgi:2-polyprenyl-6-methoxyphenol hydroxylase-like FAD-dependent oxidoreductase
VSAATPTENQDLGVDADVVIVGAGPVGLSLAILLAQQNRSVIVLERWATPYPLPRAVHFDHEVGRILQACGIGAELRAISQPAEIYEWRNAEGATLLRFGRIGAGASGWPESSMFCQPELESILDRRAQDLDGIDVRRGVEVTTLQRDDERVVVGDADDHSVSARYAVGCDGANSTVRDLVGVTPLDLGFFYDWLIVDVILDEPRVFDPLNLQICDPVRPTTAVSGGPGRRRWEFMRLPHESLDALNDETRAWELLVEWDVTPDNARLERHAVYTFQARYAERWRAGRVLLAGDAAHQMPPFAGQGLCAGLRDAANLAWKLDLVLDSRASDLVLDTYQQERLPSARQAIQFSIELGQVICVPDPDEAAARDRAMAAAVTAELADIPEIAPIDDGVVHPTAPNAGRLFVQGVVDGGLFDDAYGAGWRLVTVADDADRLEPTLLRWFESIGGRVVVLTEPDDTYARWFADHHATWALQRPDFHLFATATGADGANDLVAHLRGQLGAATPIPSGARI